MSKITGYIGTYTKGDSKGIYKFTLDKEMGSLDDALLAAEIGNPTYLTISKDAKHLYSVAKIGTTGGTAAFSIRDDGTLQLINYQVEEGSSPCHVNLDSKNRYLLSANYHKGEVSSYPIKEDGSVESPSSKVKHEGSGPHADRQQKAYAHYISQTPDEKYVCAVDLGSDKLFVYTLEDGILNNRDDLNFSTRPGSGPRHLVFHPNGRFSYILTELTSNVIALEYSPEEGFKELQYISALPEGFLGESWASAIRITPDGNYLYAGNRGHDSIAVFKIDQNTGKLQFVEHAAANIKEPRDFNIDPSGSFLIAANQNSNTVISFSIDKSTGRLTPTGSSISVPSPVCVEFAK
jgi:6-phosphogluconolactonase